MIKVSVQNKAMLICSEDETMVLSPPELQVDLNNIMAEMSSVHARTFVRPSGTEDVLRVYAEAETIEHVNKLLELATHAIYKYFIIQSIS
jgi:phosphoacetylglucosamine mutase